MPEEQPRVGTSNGVVIKIPGTKTEIRASEGAVATVERGWEHGLQWSHENPPQFYAVIGLIALAVVVYGVRKVIEARMKINFRATRDDTKKQLRNETREPKLPFDRSQAHREDHHD